MQSRAIRRSRIVVVSQSNRNFDHFRRSRMRRGIVVSYSRIAIVITALVACVYRPAECTDRHDSCRCKRRVTADESHSNCDKTNIVGVS